MFTTGLLYRPLNLVLIKKNQPLHSGYQYWNDNEAATDHGGVMADSCIRRIASLVPQHALNPYWLSLGCCSVIGTIMFLIRFNTILAA